MQVSDYLPKFYENNREMQNLVDSEEYEFEHNLKLDIDNSFKDTFALAATETGINNFEKMLGIRSDETTETSEFRRRRILSRLISSIPFTETFLKNRLDSMLGEGNWEYTISYSTYTLTINSIQPRKCLV